MPRTAAQIRREFIDFFREKYAHTFVPSSPVVPHDDPTLMFTNAGMNQFKPIFLGQHAADVDKWPGAVPGSPRRAVNTQKCIRAGGKHNDLDDVGHDTYHHTFFEMLGNWSFGDYFKKEAIEWAWELLTKIWNIDPQRLHATYFGGLRKGAGPKDKPVVDDASEPRPAGSGNTSEPRPAGRGPASDQSKIQNPKSTIEGAVPTFPPSHVPTTTDWELEPDYEARDLWLKILPPDRVHPGNMKDNFWEMGDTGPCGPCSEIHIDLTPDKSGGKLVNAGDARVMEIWNLVFIQFNRGGDGKLTPLPAKHVDTGMGFERVCAVVRGVETGRVGQVSNYDTDVFSPIFAAIQKVTGAPAYSGRLEGESQNEERRTPEESKNAERRTQKAGESATRNESGPAPSSLLRSDFCVLTSSVMTDVSYRVIADHIRTLTFAITDGATPDKEGRGYVLRRILRRAVRYGWQYLNVHKPFLGELVPAVVEAMGEAFPELRNNPQRVIDIIRDEEESFGRTLERGIALFEEAADYAVRHHHGEIRGGDAFKLHDTFGFPIDLTEIMARERDLRVDIGEYERRMEEAKSISRGQKRDLNDAFDPETYERLSKHGQTTDDSLKYIEPFECSAFIWTLGAQEVAHDTPLGAREGDEVNVGTNRTTFYVEQGGQVSDTGVIEAENGCQIEVTQVIRLGNSIYHRGVVRHGNAPHAGPCRVRVDRPRRNVIMQNHTATHVMNWALREVLDPEGTHLQQKGSLVDPEKTRFDFSHPKPLTPAEIERIEKLCEKQIAEKLTVFTNNNVPVSQVEAMKINGLRAVFGEKYPEMVRVVSIGVPVTEEDARAAGRSDWLLKNPGNPEWRKYSIEFCGGTHVKSTGEIAHFVLTHEEAVAKGVRRLVGVSGQRAKLIREAGAAALLEAEALRSANGAVDARRADAETPDFPARVARLQKDVDGAELPVLDRLRLRALLAELGERVKKQQKAAAADMAGVLNARVDELLPAAAKHGATTVFVAELPDAPVEQLKGAADRIKQKCGSAAIFIGVRGVDGKVMLLAAVTDDLIKKGVKAGDLVKAVAPMVEGGGGGPPTMAQAGGKNAAKLPEALAAAKSWITGKIGG